jgi:hypothetical protein
METPVGGQTSKTLRYTVEIPGCESAKTNVVWWKQPWLRHITLQ